MTCAMAAIEVNMVLFKNMAKYKVKNKDPKYDVVNGNLSLVIKDFI